MLIMAIGGGLAYNYENYISPGSYGYGEFSTVLKDTLRTFQKDFRLIQPKKFGFAAGKQP